MTAPTTSTLTDDQRHCAGLAALGASPGMLRKFLDGYTAAEAWEAIGRGRHRADLDRRYRHKAVRPVLDKVETACAQSGVSVLVPGRAGYPSTLVLDHQAPAVLFSTGDAAVLDDRPRVAVVGTRSATPYGIGVATELGGELARAGVVVVSGMASGIDSAAHAGALGVGGGAPTVGVLGTAHDGASRSQAALEEALRDRGAVLSEIPPGVHGARWWFAVRSRVIAALAHVVVVVECHHRGGSLHTVAAAVARGVTVTAVPGSVRSPASAGTNRLLVEGAVPVRDVADVLTAVELRIVTDPHVTPPRPLPRPTRASAPARRAPPLAPAQSRVRQALDQDPATLETVVRRSGLSLGDVSLALEALADAGLAVGDRGWWSRPRG